MLEVRALQIFIESVRWYENACVLASARTRLCVRACARVCVYTENKHEVN